MYGVHGVYTKPGKLICVLVPRPLFQLLDVGPIYIYIYLDSVLFLCFYYFYSLNLIVLLLYVSLVGDNMYSTKSMWWGIKGTLPDNSLKIPNPKSKKDRQHNGKKKIKGQIIIYEILQKRKIAQHEPQ
jgi:hypothetical protein